MGLDGSEQVLCVPSSVVRSSGPWEGLRSAPGGVGIMDAWTIMDRSRFLTRTEDLEKDTKWLQVIPYGTIWVILDGVPKCLVYRRARAGSEGRLHDLLSIGFGGHVNPGDENNGFFVMPALRRELHEELGLSTMQLDRAQVENVGMIWSPAWTGVEAVHLGIYYEVLLGDAGLDLAAEDSIDIVGWMSHMDLARLPIDDFEVWSQAVIRQRLLTGEHPNRAEAHKETA